MKKLYFKGPLSQSEVISRRIDLEYIEKLVRVFEFTCLKLKFLKRYLKKLDVEIFFLT